MDTSAAPKVTVVIAAYNAERFIRQTLDSLSRLAGHDQTQVNVAVLHREFESDLVRLANTADVRRGYEQLANLELEFRYAGTTYRCPTGQHDDLGISFAMLAWAAQHQHLKEWMRSVEATRRPPTARAPGYGWGAFT